MRIVDTGEYVSMLKGLVEEGREVSLMLSGSSMAPFFGKSARLYLFQKTRSSTEKREYGFLSKTKRPVCHAPNL